MHPSRLWWWAYKVQEGGGGEREKLGLGFWTGGVKMLNIEILRSSDVLAQPDLCKTLASKIQYPYRFTPFISGHAKTGYTGRGH
jgi:hypothetical protein